MIKHSGNPYGHCGPILDPVHFYGRSREVSSILSLLRHLQSVSLVGPGGAGKTSLLHYISHPSTLEMYRLNPNQYIFIYINGAKLTNLTRADIFRLMIDEAQAAAAGSGRRGAPAAPPGSDSISFEEFSNKLKTIAKADLKLIFLFDDFEGISQNRNLNLDFFGGLRGIASNFNVAYVTASEDSLFELTYAKEVQGSPFFNIFNTIRLKPFTENEARSFITEPSSAGGVAFSEETVAFILSLAGQDLLPLQIACAYAFDLQSQQGDLQAPDYTLLRSRIEAELLEI